MVERRQKDQEYASLWRSVVNFMKNSTGLSISGIARAGSRRKGTYNTYSDLDIIFAIAKDPAKTEVYPELVNKLKKGFPDASVSIGSSYNVIKFEKGSLDMDIVLRTTSQFQKQVQDYKLENL